MKVVAQAPCRIGIFGGGTDLPVFSDKYGGLCISMAINLRRRVVIEPSETFLLEEEQNGNSEFVQAFLDTFNVSTPLKINTYSDVPLRSGLGASASISVALVGAITRAQHRNYNRYECARMAWEIETKKLGLYGGKQDQMAAGFGNFNTYYFNADGSSRVQTFTHKAASTMRDHIMLFHIGENRENPKIQEELLTLTKEQEKSLLLIKHKAELAVDAIENGDIDLVASLLRDSWQAKKESNPLVSNTYIDGIYNTAIESGALAGKLNGSGGGGHMVFIVRQIDRTKIRKALEDIGCRSVDFSIDRNGLDTRIL